MRAGRDAALHTSTSTSRMALPSAPCRLPIRSAAARICATSGRPWLAHRAGHQRRQRFHRPGVVREQVGGNGRSARSPAHQLDARNEVDRLHALAAARSRRRRRRDAARRRTRRCTRRQDGTASARARTTPPRALPAPRSSPVRRAGAERPRRSRSSASAPPIAGCPGSACEWRQGSCHSARRRSYSARGKLHEHRTPRAVQPHHHVGEVMLRHRRAAARRHARPRPDMQKDAGAAARHRWRGIVPDDHAEPVLIDGAHLLGARPIDARHRVAIDDGVVVARRAVVDAFGRRAKGKIRERIQPRRRRRREPEGGVEGKASGGSSCRRPPASEGLPRRSRRRPSQVPIVRRRWAPVLPPRATAPAPTCARSAGAFRQCYPNRPW